jgi:hypothetical protein
LIARRGAKDALNSRDTAADLARNSGHAKPFAPGCNGKPVLTLDVDQYSSALRQ